MSTARYNSVDDSFWTHDRNLWTGDTAVLGKDSSPAEETRAGDHHSEANILNFPAVIPEIQSAELHHGCMQLVAASEAAQIDRQRYFRFGMPCDARHGTLKK